MRLSPVSTLESPADAPRDLFALGELVSDTFEIRLRLGEGGMGQVFEAHDRSLNRRVALKAAWPHVDPTSIRKEAQALAAMRHPSMVAVHALGQHRGIDYVVMERIFGDSLESYLARRRARRSPLAIVEAVEILIGIAEGLAVVHAAGIAHRDVKPANVMLAPGNRIVLMDFGIFQPEFDLTKPRLVTGSPQYIAPETIENAIAPGAAFLVDVYAFGIVLFELLAGHVPFDGDNVMRILHLQRTQAPPDLEPLRPDAPSRLCALARELLAKDPKERPVSMLAVGGELKAMLAQHERDRERAAGERFSVLIAEDDPVAAEILRELVAHAWPSAEIRSASDGEQALELAQKKLPHLLLLDLDMPRMTGVELCMCLRASPDFTRCTIVAISGHAEPAEVALLRQLGVSRIVMKGGELAALIDELREAAAPGTRFPTR
jgi:serine/threonine protein kinase